MSKISVSLKPTAGFCIKSTTVQPGVLKISAVSPGPNSLEPRSTSVAVPIHRKIFVNIAWDSQVPPPPEGNEEAIQRAMHGDDEHLNPDAWFVPVIVSDPRQDTDKSGNPSVVFDCIYHTSIKSRTISTPNIASKGKLLPRTVLIPAGIPTATSKRPLIEELPPSAAVAVNGNKKSDTPTKGILKPGAQPSTKAPAVSKPKWGWSKTESGSIEITIHIPVLTHALVAETMLELEARRLLLAVPGHPPLDINVGVSDAEIAAKLGAGPDGGLTLKRERELDVEAATAEWRVSEGVLVVVA
ncbi:hypothetical protein K438DRAFT_1921006 [Mycena galopus ATCC 62051]|nr:hypothetical protein K438DRAFT_1921006 [Mycena galopus ATCC 62051]